MFQKIVLDFWEIWALCWIFDSTITLSVVTVQDHFIWHKICWNPWKLPPSCRNKEWLLSKAFLWHIWWKKSLFIMDKIVSPLLFTSILMQLPRMTQFWCHVIKISILIGSMIKSGPTDFIILLRRVLHNAQKEKSIKADTESLLVLYNP